MAITARPDEVHRPHGERARQTRDRSGDWLRPRPAVGDLSLEVVASISRFEVLRAEWTRLERAERDNFPIFQSHNFLSHWMSAYCQPSSAGRWIPRIVTVSERGRLVLALPLAIEPGKGRTLRWMGEPIAQYGDAVGYDDLTLEPAFEQAWSEIASWTDVDAIELTNVRDDALIRPLLDQVIPATGEDGAAPYVDLAGMADFDAYQDTQKSKHKRSRRRNRRRLAEEGELGFVAAREGEAAADLADKALRFKRAWLDRQGLTSRAFADQRALDLLRKLSVAEDRPVGLVATALTIAGAPVAIELGFSRNRDYLSFLGSFSPDHAHLGPGNVQMEDTIDWCIAHGHAVYDLLPPEDDYKGRWTEKSVGVRNYALAKTQRGKAMRLYSGQMRPQLKRIYRALPSGLRQWLGARLFGRGDLDERA